MLGCQLGCGSAITAPIIELKRSDLSPADSTVRLSFLFKSWKGFAKSFFDISVVVSAKAWIMPM